MFHKNDFWHHMSNYQLVVGRWTSVSRQIILKSFVYDITSYDIDNSKTIS